MTHPLDDTRKTVFVPIGLKEYFERQFQPGFEDSRIVYIDPTGQDEDFLGTDQEQEKQTGRDRLAALLGRILRP